MLLVGAVGDELAQHPVGDDDDVRNFAALEAAGDRGVAGADGKAAAGIGTCTRSVGSSRYSVGGTCYTTVI